MQHTHSVYAQLRKKYCANSSLFVGTLLQRAAARWPDTKAAISDTEIITYQELYRRACLVSVRLRELGVQPRDRVVIWYENKIDFYASYFGAYQVGAVVTPVNTFLQPVELAAILVDAQPRAIIVSDALVAKLSEIQKQLPPCITGTDLAALFTQTLSEPLTPVQLDVHELCLLLYTSGTTGVPKGVMLSSHALLTNVLQIIAVHEIMENERIYCPLPLFHAFPQMLAIYCAFFIGASVILVEKIDRRLLRMGLEERPSIVFGVPALFGLFCLMRDAPVQSVHSFISGGDALADKIRMGFELLYGRKICDGYGLTETAPVLCFNVMDDWSEAGTIGQPLPGVSLSIRNASNEPVAGGEVGVLWVKGENLMLGYYRAPEQTARVLQNGWFNTGDLVRQDRQGRLVICGREKDLIIHQGFNIYPQEIENVLRLHPAVRNAAVVGVRIQDAEVPVAYVVIAPTEAMDDVERALRHWCSNRLAAYKVPRTIVVVDELPLSPTGKIDKKMLKKKFAEKA